MAEIPPRNFHKHIFVIDAPHFARVVLVFGGAENSFTSRVESETIKHELDK